MGAPSHLRALDLARVLAGPWCAQNLADSDVDVIKVECPDAGDDIRIWGPPWLKDGAGNNTTKIVYYPTANRNKRSIIVDVSAPEGQDIVRQLVTHTDVVLENYEADRLKKYGLDYASLETVKPDLVYCSIAGFSQTGLYAPRAGYDFIVQDMGGFMSLTDEHGDLSGGGPQKTGAAISDLITGMYVTVAVLTALTHRGRTDEGQYIGMALLDVQIAMLANMNTNYLASGEASKRWGNTHPNIVSYQTLQAANSWITVAVGNDGQFRRSVDAGGIPELADDPHFATNLQRVTNCDALVPILAEMVKRFGKDKWIDKLEAAGVSYGPINPLDKVFDNEQVQAHGPRVDLPYPSADTVKLVGSPVKISVTLPEAASYPPLLDGRTGVILRGVLNLSADQVGSSCRHGMI